MRLRDLLLASAIACTAGPAFACGGFWDVGCNVGKTLEKAAGDTGHALEKASGDTGHALEKASGGTGHALEKASGDTGHALEKASGDTGHALEKASGDTGHALEGGGQYVGKHPWETALAVALIAGGGYLVVYEGYTLAITAQGVQIVSGATSGVIAGSTLSAGGVAIELLPGINGSKSAPSETTSLPLGSRNEGSGGNGAVGAPTANITYAAPTGSGSDPNVAAFFGPQPSRSGSASNPPKNIGASAVTGGQPVKAPVDMTGGDGAYKETMLAWPWLSQSASTSEKLSYAEKVTRWADRVQPINDFDPAQVPPITQAELRLLDALNQLDTIKDTEGHTEAVEYAEKVQHPISTFIGDQVADKAKEKAIEFLIGESAAKYFGWVGIVSSAIESVPLADDDMYWRDVLKEKLRDQFARYLDKRLQQGEPQRTAELPAPQGSQVTVPSMR